MDILNANFKIAVGIGSSVGKLENITFNTSWLKQFSAKYMIIPYVLMGDTEFAFRNNPASLAKTP